jgi:hypothetical protein
VTEQKPVALPKIEPASPADLDMADPMLSKDIEFTPERIAFLEGRVTKCFLCKWILEDYRAHGTLAGHRSEDSQFEIFPVRGEIDHLYLELYGKPYPWKRPLIEEESRPHSFTKEEKLVPVEPVVAPSPRPDPERNAAEDDGPSITIKPDPNAVPVSKPKQRPNNIRM